VTQSAASASHQVQVLCGLPRDAQLTAAILASAGISSRICDRTDGLAQAVGDGTIGTLLVAEEALSAPVFGLLRSALSEQPPWSDVPIILFASRMETTIDRLLLTLGGNITALERPIRSGMLVSAVRAALKARQRQYQLRDLLRSMEQVTHRLEEQDRRKDEFLAMLGHELRNPLAAIMTGVTVLQAAKDQRLVTRQVEIIQRQSRHLARLVDDLLDVSRVTMGKINVHLNPIDMSEIVERCVQHHACAAASSGHLLTWERWPHPLIVEGDSVRLEQVVSNLLGNALRYTPPGGHVQVSTRQSESCATLSVRDNGVGIEPELGARIFDLFVQATPNLDRSKGGLGLGLALVKSLVERHGGTVSVHSEGRNLGATFEVRIPLSAQEPDSHTPMAPRMAPAGQHVVVIEDNDDARETLRTLLSMWGFSVETAADGADGIRRIQEARPSWAIVDIGLPKVDGYEVARRIRATMDGSAPLLIAITGYGQPEDRRRALEAGFDHHMAKPVDLGALADLLAFGRKGPDQGSEGKRDRPMHEQPGYRPAQPS